MEWWPALTLYARNRWIVVVLIRGFKPASQFRQPCRDPCLLLLLLLAAAKVLINSGEASAAQTGSGSLPCTAGAGCFLCAVAPCGPGCQTPDPLCLHGSTCCRSNGDRQQRWPGAAPARHVPAPAGAQEKGARGGGRRVQVMQPGPCAAPHHTPALSSAPRCVCCRRRRG